MKRVKVAWDDWKEGAEKRGQQVGEFTRKVMEGGVDLARDIYKNRPDFYLETPLSKGLEGFWDNIFELDDNEKSDQPKAKEGELETFIDPPQNLTEGGEYRITAKGTVQVVDKHGCREEEVNNRRIEFYAPITSDIRLYFPEGGEGNVPLRYEFNAFDSNGNEETFTSSELIFGNTNSDPGKPGEFGQISCVDNGSFSDYVIVDRSKIKFEIERLDDASEEVDDIEPPPQKPEWNTENDIDINLDRSTRIDIENYREGQNASYDVEFSYNPDNRKIEGDRFEMSLDKDGVNLDYDETQPPDWLSDRVRDGLDVIGDVTDGVLDFAVDAVPPPFNTILRSLQDALDDEEEGGEEPQEFTFTVESCVEGEIEEEQITLSLLPSQEPVVGQVIAVRNRVERGRCSLIAFEAIKITVSKDTVRGQARFGDTEQQTRKFFGWLQFTRDGEMIGEEVLIRYDPQVIPFNPRADDYLVQSIDGAELEDEVIPLD